MKLLPELLFEFVDRSDLQAKLVKRMVSHQIQAIGKDQQWVAMAQGNGGLTVMVTLLFLSS